MRLDGDVLPEAMISDLRADIVDILDKISDMWVGPFLISTPLMMYCILTKDFV